MIYEVNSPVLLIVFNRPDQVKSIIDKFREVKVKKLYIAADAPRHHNSIEVSKCAETLNIIDQIDWSCKVYRKINEVNLGSHTTIPNAIDWFFENEEFGIVLEDDCIPSISFFRFCDVLLDRYRYEEKIMWINGSNISYFKTNLESDYLCSIYPISWGWASWRRAWSLFDEKYRKNRPSDLNKNTLQRLSEAPFIVRLFWKINFDYAYAINNWDFRWTLVAWENDGLACTPLVNLISNVGFGSLAGMHKESKNDPRGNIPAVEIFGEIRSPDQLVQSVDLDKYLNTVLYRINIFSILKLFMASRFVRLRNLSRKIRNVRI